MIDILNNNGLCFFPKDSEKTDSYIARLIVDKESAKLRALCAHVPTSLACLHAHVLTCLACLHAHVLTCLAFLRALRAYLLTC